MIRYRLHLISLLVLLIVSRSNISAVANPTIQNRNAISGTITNIANRPLNRIRVELQDEVEMMVTQTYTDTAGRYTFRNLSAGTFIVKVHSDGNHAGQSVRVILYAARTGGGAHYEQVDFRLKSNEEVKGTSIP